MRTRWEFKGIGILGNVFKSFAGTWRDEAASLNPDQIGGKQLRRAIDITEVITILL